MKSQLHCRLGIIVLLVLGTSLWWSCNKPEDQAPPAQTVEYSPELPRDWMSFAYNAVKRQGWFALDASRFYAYSAITAYESMVHGLPGHRSLAGQLQGLDVLPQPESGKTYDWGVVLCHAMPRVMEALMPNMQSATHTEMEELVENQSVNLRNQNNLSDEVMNNSKAFAELLANAVIKWSESDNRAGMESLIYTPPSRDGNPQYWNGSTLNQSFMMPFWWTSRPFVINTYRLCEPPPPYQYSTDPSSAYYKDVQEVYEASFDPAKVAIGNYWANNPGKSGTPAGSWLGIANQLVDQYNLDLSTTLRMYVMLSIGTRDGFIACWYAKYKFYLQRPVSYIRDVMGHTNWSSPVPTPPYPDYTSGTSVNAGVSSEILTRLFGNKSFYDEQHRDKGFGTREFSSFKAAGREAFHSRIYGGVHMRRACEIGFEQGECIGTYLWNNLSFVE